MRRLHIVAAALLYLICGVPNGSTQSLTATVSVGSTTATGAVLNVSFSPPIPQTSPVSYVLDYSVNQNTFLLNKAGRDVSGAGVCVTLTDLIWNMPAVQVFIGTRIVNCDPER